MAYCIGLTLTWNKFYFFLFLLSMFFIIFLFLNKIHIIQLQIEFGQQVMLE